MVNETLLSVRRVVFTATSPADNPFCASNPTNCVTLLREFLAQSFPAYPDLALAGYGTEQILGIAPELQDPVLGHLLGRRHPPGEPAGQPAGRLRAHEPVRRARVDRRQLADRGRESTSARTRGTRRSVSSATNRSRGRRAGWSTTRCRRGPSGCRTRRRAPGSPTRCRSRRATSSARSPRPPNTNPFDLNEDYGPDNNDRRHNMVLDAAYLIPKVDVQFAGIYSYRSPLSFSVSRRAFSSTATRSATGPSRGGRGGATARRTSTSASANS